MDEHTPVLVEEALTALGFDESRTQEPADGLYVDATFGRGGHAARILARLADTGRLLAIDRDPQAVAEARRRFAADQRVVVVHAAFGALEALVAAHGGGRECRGILFDLGVSSPQLDQAARGFSFQQDGPLDMRMDTTSGPTAAQWLAQAQHNEIRDVIARLGEERFARRVADAIVREREAAPITTTAQLSRIVAGVVRTREPGKNPATRSFQALRMHVNDELGEIERGLNGALRALCVGGRLAVISFHSLEDRLVKNLLRRESSPDRVLARLPMLPASYAPRMRLVGKKIKATSAETQANPRARSAVLRVAEKLVAGGA
ncbi:MAG: 16S rRNA (cytosine(1402)-N(4))-methyltransferase RsmH [Steroidobacteraceae bacterium]